MVDRRRGGYTLVELMLVVGIVGIISQVGYLVMLKTVQAQQMSDALATIQQGAFTTFDVASKMLRQASASSVVIDRLDASQPPWSRIRFTVPNTGKTVTFYQKGQTLYIGNNPVFTNLRSLTFSYPNSTASTVISMSMTFEKSTGSGRTKAIQLFIQNIKIQN